MGEEGTAGRCEPMGQGQGREGYTVTSEPGALGLREGAGPGAPAGVAAQVWVYRLSCPSRPIKPHTHPPSAAGRGSPLKACVLWALASAAASAALLIN